MRILAFEYITGGGMLNEVLPVSLAAEGDRMLHALANDLAAIPAVDVVVTRDARLPALDAAVVSEIRLEAGSDFGVVWQRLLNEVDAVWPVAPETGGVLERICDDVLAAGKLLLNSPPESVRLAASKQRTLAQLAAHGIPVVPTWTLADAVPDDGGPWVVKPDDGVGCEGLRLFASLAQARRAARGDAVLQPFLNGIDLSLSLVCDRGRASLLSVNRQQIRRAADTLLLDGCVASCAHRIRERFAPLADAIARAVPGLRGYVGVDLLLCGRDVRVLEINPRLTSSYVALPRGPAFNPAQRVLEVFLPEQCAAQPCRGSVPPAAVALEHAL